MIRSFLSFASPRLFIRHMWRSRPVYYATLALHVKSSGPSLVDIPSTDTYMDWFQNRNTFVAWCATRTNSSFCLCVFTDILPVLKSDHSSNSTSLSSQIAFMAHLSRQKRRLSLRNERHLGTSRLIERSPMLFPPQQSILLHFLPFCRTLSCHTTHKTLTFFFCLCVFTDVKSAMT